MGRTTIFWFLLLLSLSVPSVSSIKTLSSIRELADNNIEFGKTFPGHGLKLLYWLAHNIQIDQNNVIDLGDIDPSQGDYGFHCFGKYERLLPREPNVDYYALGDLNTNVHSGSRQLSSYVTEDFYNVQSNPHNNIDRIIVRSDRNSQRRVRRVYLTLHYDPGHTWEISPRMLTEIQNFPTLRAFLTQAHYDFNSRNRNYQQILHCIRRDELRRRRRSFPECDTHEGLRLDVRSDDTTKARITWSGIPKTILTSDLVLNVYANMNSSDSTALESYGVGLQQSGSIDTSVPLHPRLQVRLMEKTWHFLSSNEKLIWASPEFDEGNREFPTKVVGYDASLQLFAKQGKACARLYIKRSFTDWKNEFYNSWVGFYLTRAQGHSSNVKRQWATKFYENQNRHTDGYLAYEYEFGLDIQGGVQVRFFLEKAPSSVLAQAVPWGEEAIRPIQDNVRGYNASLQLMAIGGKACARLYIKKSFTNWKKRFTKAWVGFYSSSYASSRSFKTWNWVTKFKRNEDKYTEEYMAYDYHSNMAVRQGVEARFFLSKDYSQERCRARL